MQLAIAARSLSAKHRTAKSRLVRHVIWFAVLTAMIGIGTWSRAHLPAKHTASAVEVLHGAEWKEPRTL